MLKKTIFIFLFFLLTSVSKGQVITQTFVDRCTGEVKIVTANFNQGPTAVAFYNRVRVFTYQDYTSGVLQSWLTETYAWWNSLSPCSNNQQQANQAQQTVAQTTQTVANLPKPPATPPPPAQSSSNTSSPPSQETTSTSNTESGSGSTESSSSESGGEGESSESEESSDSESEESDDGDKEENEKDKKRRTPKPILMSGDVVFLQNLRGNFDDIISIGITQSSLMGDRSYGGTALVWSNLSQFNLSANTSVIKFDDTYQPKSVNSYGVGYSKMFKTHSLNLSVSKMFLNSKYGIFGGGMGYSSMIDNSQIDKIKGISNSLSYNGIWTKPFRINERWNYTPVIVIAGSPLYYSTTEKELIWNKHIMFVSSNSFDFQISNRFRANFNYTLIKGTDKNLPMLNSFVIGSKISYIL